MSTRADDQRPAEPTKQPLAEPLTLPNGQVLGNRLMKAALSEALADPDHAPDQRLVRLYRSWARGGFGLIVTGNVMIDRSQLGEPGNVVVEDDRHLPALRRWADASGDVPVWVQLNHPGRQSNPLAIGHRPVAPSPVALDLPGAATPRELTHPEILDLIQRFANSARVCERAGFAGVQVHAAHGYLISQFLSPRTNLRTDEWGGDAERRRRFLLEVVRSIRAAVSPSFCVGVKLNSADFQRGGFTEDESRAVLAALSTEGVDLIEISGGSYEEPAMAGSAAASTRAREAYFLEYARTARAMVDGVPLAVTGGFRTRAAMESAVASGECEVVGLGRPSVVRTDAAEVLLDRKVDAVEAPAVALGARRLLGRVADLKALDAVLEIGWYADQMHRIGAGLTPDLQRSNLRVLASVVRRNGRASFRPKRSG